MSDTLEFFKAVLPNEGRYFLVDLFDGRQAPRHILMPDLEMFARKVLEADVRPGASIYHACASYMAGSVQVPDPKNPGKFKAKFRVAENLGRMKSFWIDVDCGQDKFDKGDGYLKKGDAVTVIDEFAASVGLTLPMVVDSGNGIHFYWPLTISIGPKSWCMIATQLKNVLIERDIKQDRTRTADAASILRPPGTYNRKDPANPKLVRVRRWAEETSPEDFLACIKGTVSSPTPPNTPNSVSTSALDRALVAAVMGEQTLDLDAAPSFLTGLKVDNGLAAHKHEFLPVSIEQVATHCQQVRFMRDTKGDVSREVWRGIIGLTTFCVEGKGPAESWTENRAATGHEDTDWEKRYDTWSSPPTSCTFFLNENPEGCKGCKFRDPDGTPQKKSPISLGAMVPEHHEDATEIVAEDEDGTVLTITVPAKPRNFRYEVDGLWRDTVDKDGIASEIFLTKSNFYVYHWTKDADAPTFHALARLHQPRGGIIEWAIPMSATASPGEMMKELTNRSIMPGDSPVAAKHLTAYVKDAIDKIKSEIDEMNTMTSFGWTEDHSGFLIGDRMHHVDGTTRPVLLGGRAVGMAKMFPKKRGSLQGYTNAVNSIYNLPGMEPMQYALCNAFGSTLTPFSGEPTYNGVLFAITGGRTARGKTTIAMAALYAFGDALQMTHAKTTTLNARYGLMGAHGNVPILFDEFTDIEPKELSEWAYSTSEGREKGRMTKELNMAERGTWGISPFVTANTDLRARLADKSNNTVAESVRLIQIHIDNYRLPQLDENQVAYELQVMGRNMGHAGEEFIKYVTANLPQVQSDMKALVGQVSAHIPGSAYRYYRAHMVCTLTAARIMIDLGIVAFDYEKLFAFAVTLMRDMCKEVEAVSSYGEGDMLASMINSMAEQIITTFGFSEDRRTIPEEVRCHGEIIGRRIIGNAATDQKYHGRLYISARAIASWGTDNRTTLRQVLDAARAAGALVSADEKFNLAAGTKSTGATIACIVLDYPKLGGSVQLPGLTLASSTLDEATGS